MQKQLLRLPDVRRIVGLSRSEIYRRIASKTFPPPVPLGERIRAWDSSAISSWVDQRIEAGRKAA